LKWFIAIVLTIVVLVSGGTAVILKTDIPDRVREALEPEVEPTVVRTRVVERGDLTRTVDAPGLVEPERTVDVGARVSAKVIAIPVEVGDDVKEGEVVARLDSEDVLARLREAEHRLEAERARLIGMEAALKLAEVELGRQRELFETGDVARSAFDSAEANYQQALSNLETTKASIKALEASIAAARKDLDNTVLTAPISGTVIARYTELGEMVLGSITNVGTTLMQIADLSRMVMRARVDETNIAAVKPGQHVTVFINAYDEREFTGTVERVHIQRQQWRDGTNYIETEVLLDVPEGERLFTGLNANAQIEVETLEDVLKVPSQAVLDTRVDELPLEVAASPYVDNRKTYARVVFRVEDGKALLTPVSIGASDLIETVIIGGLSEGDRVVTGPFRVLSELEHEQDVSLQSEVLAEADANERDPETAAGPEATDDGADG